MNWTTDFLSNHNHFDYVDFVIHPFVQGSYFPDIQNKDYISLFIFSDHLFSPS